MQAQVLYAPFIKASDKVKKDVSDLSLADFHPQRFALNYDPPMVILEYLVPSTGKLYHHKMKLRSLTGQSTVKDGIKYLHKRHPLYFTTNKISEEQITDLLKRLIYRLKMKEEAQNSEKQAKKASTEKAVAPLQVKDPNAGQAAPEKPVFKSGSRLPAVDDFESGGQEKNQERAKQMFDDLDDYDDDFDNSVASKQDKDDFNANELLNFQSYQDKRKAQA